MKLQKLVYYCQAWNVVWEREPLFPEAIEAWINGPVVRALYDLHKGCLQVACLDIGDATNLTPTQKENIDIFKGLIPKVVANAILGMMNYAVIWYKSDGALGMDQMADHFIHVILGNVKNPVPG